MNDKNVFLLGVLFLIVLFAYPTAYHASKTSTELTVLDKERIGLNGDYKYLIYGEEEVFENTDVFLYFKFNSSDVQRDLRIGETYEVEVAGWRVPFLSMHRNIIRVIKE